MIGTSPKEEVWTLSCMGIEPELIGFVRCRK